MSVPSDVDPLISLLKQKKDVLKLFGRMWDALYIEYGEKASPDIGKRREILFRLLLENELGLKVEKAPSTERDWDIKVVFPGGKERYYSIKTTEGINIIKVAWNGFPSLERARKHKFEYPILYITREREGNSISIYVFEPEDIERAKSMLGENNFWWIPSGGNPRGFGITKNAVEELMDIAKMKGNYVSVDYNPAHFTDDRVRMFWRKLYSLYKEIVT